MKTWNVFIFDEDSGFEQPLSVQADTKAEARKFGNRYIKKWNLKGGCVTKIEKKEELHHEI